jgi:inhibitor of KinA sporulation pathway (predicted exonuclease)
MPPSKNPDLVVSLDLEFNQPSMRIIQIGAVVGSLKSSRVLSRFSCFVNPEEALSLEISKLCGISPGVLEMGPSLAEAYSEMAKWLVPFEPRQLNPLTWGGGDSIQLQSQLGIKGAGAFGRRWVDVKTVYVSWQIAHNEPYQGGLKASMRKMGVPFFGRPHDAVDDAHSTFLMYCELLTRMAGGRGLSPQVAV